MATPHVSGVASLVWGMKPDATAAQVREALEMTAEDLGAAGRDNEFGHGLVQAVKAADYLLSGGAGGGGGDGGGGGEVCTNPVPCDRTSTCCPGFSCHRKTCTAK